MADHALLLDVIPMFANLTLRVYSYRLSELVQNPNAMNFITSNTFTLKDWSNPAYNNLVQLILWAASILLTMLFHTFLRVNHFTFRYKTPSLGFMIIVKALFLLFDMIATALFLYTFLVSLKVEIFGKSPDIPLMLSIMVSSPLISTICNSFINLPLLFSFGRLKNKKSASEILKSCLEKLFSIENTVASLFSVYYIVVTAYLLNKLKLLDLNTEQLVNILDLVQWSPKQIVVSIVIINLVANYLIGIAFLLVFWLLRPFIHL